MASQPGSPLSSPTKNAKKQKLSGTLVEGWHAALLLLTRTIRYTSCARRNREQASSNFCHSVIRAANLGLDRIPHWAPQGPNLNPRYPRVFANRPSRPFSNPMRRVSLPAHALPLLAPRPLPRRAFSAAEGRTVRVVAALWKKRKCLLVLLAHHDRHHQSRGGRRRTILSVSNTIICKKKLCPSETDGDFAMGLDVEGDETGSSTDTDTD
jgi:hypothetical protein